MLISFETYSIRLLSLIQKYLMPYPEKYQYRNYETCLKMIILRLCAVTALLFLFLTAQTQDDDIDKYFDDGKHSTSTKLIKIGYDAHYNEKLISFEHRLFNITSLEYTIGFSNLNRLHKLHRDFPIPNLPETGNLITVMVFLRVYKLGYFERVYVGIIPRITIIDSRLYGDFSLVTFGYQRPIKERLLFDIFTGIGPRFIYLGNKPRIDDATKVFIPLQFRVCYAF